jgi:hypothetical protein
MGKPTFEAGFSDQIAVVRNAFSDERTLVADSCFNRRYEPSESIGGFKLTRGTETSQYPEERTSTETPLVVASESGPGQ